MFIAITEKGELVASKTKKNLIAEIGKPFATKATVWVMPYSDNEGGGNWFLQQKEGCKVEHNAANYLDGGDFFNHYPFTEIAKGGVRYLGDKKPTWYRLQELYGARKKYLFENFSEGKEVVYLNSKGQDAIGTIGKSFRSKDIGYDHFYIKDKVSGKERRVYQCNILYQIN